MKKIHKILISILLVTASIMFIVFGVTVASVCPYSLIVPAIVMAAGLTYFVAIKIQMAFNAKKNESVSVEK